MGGIGGGGWVVDLGLRGWERGAVIMSGLGMREFWGVDEDSSSEVREWEYWSS